MRVCTRRAAAANLRAVEPRVVVVLGEERRQPRGEFVLAQQPDVFGIECVRLLLVEPRGVGVDVDDVEGSHHLVEAEYVAVLGNTPTQQREIVQQPLGNEAAVAVDEQIRLRIALGQLLVAVPQDAWQVSELRYPFSDSYSHQCLIQRDLAGGGRQQVLAAQARE